jgi:uracil-DNA glycosylase
LKKGIKAGITKKSARDLSIKRLKLLTRYIITRNEKLLIELLKHEEHYKTLINRAFTYFMPFPKVINYLNSYLNHKFDSPQKKDFEKWLITFSEIARLYGVNNTNDLYYSKFKTSDKESFYKLINEYYNIFNSNVSSAEISALFLLYNNQIITEQHINELKSLVSGKDNITENQKKLENIIKTPQPFSNTKREAEAQLSPVVQQFIDSAKQYIRNRPVCKNCLMYSKGSVILDTNVNAQQPVDIAFIGLNPGYEEFKQQKPFVGKSGQLLHKFVDPLVTKYNLSYIITNSILCWSKNSSEISNIPKTLKNCKQLTDEIHKTFPSKINVLFGADAMKAAGIKGGITKMNGQMVENTNFIIFHPSAILRDPRKLSKFETAFLNLEEYIKNINTYQSGSNTTIHTDEVKFSIPSKSIITQFDRSLTLFDVQIIGEQIVYIMIDSNGNKKYLLDTVQFPVYIKYGNYKDCEYIADKIDNVIHLTAQERKELNQKMYYDLRNKTNLNTKQ